MFPISCIMLFLEIFFRDILDAQLQKNVAAVVEMYLKQVSYTKFIFNLKNMKAKSKNFNRELKKLWDFCLIFEKFIISSFVVKIAENYQFFRGMFYWWNLILIPQNQKLFIKFSVCMYVYFRFYELLWSLWPEFEMQNSGYVPYRMEKKFYDFSCWRI